MSKYKLDPSNPESLEDSEFLEENDPSDIATIINNITETSDLYFLSLLLLDKMSESSSRRYQMIAELSYLLDTKSFLNLIHYFEGMTITIPTRNQVVDALRLISIYYYYDIHGYSWKDSLVKAGLEYSKEVSLSYRNRMSTFRELIRKIRLPKEVSGVPRGGSNE